MLVYNQAQPARRGINMKSASVIEIQNAPYTESQPTAAATHLSQQIFKDSEDFLQTLGKDISKILKKIHMVSLLLN